MGCRVSTLRNHGGLSSAGCDGKRLVSDIREPYSLRGRESVVGSGGGAVWTSYTGRMLVRQLVAVSVLVCSVSLGVVACSTTGPGTKSECNIGGCTITFDRGVDAKISVLGIDAELTAVEGNVVTLTVAGRKVTVPAGESRQAEGMNLTVQEVTPEQVVVEIATGL